MPSVRTAAVAGLFYPSDPRELARTVDALMGDAAAASTTPRALIAPHAGYIYSGAIAASAYAQLAPLRQQIRRVVLLGPSHRVRFTGMALSSAASYSTPFGEVGIDARACAELAALAEVGILDDAHAAEHSLEVHLPFLHAALDHYQLIPIVIGDASAEEVARVIEHFWHREDTLTVASSDLSHFLDYETAIRVDGETTRLIEARASNLGPEQACGCRAINGLMKVAESHGKQVTTLDVRNSGDTAGDRARVVGYGSYAVT